MKANKKRRSNSPPEKKRNSYAATAFWDLAETPLLQSAESDVLAIFDCCYASHAHKGGLENQRTYELLAASPRDRLAYTYSPGSKSFTTALIKSLNELLEEFGNRNFTTTKLLDKINTNRNPPSMLWDRLHKHERHVQLAPLEKKFDQVDEKPFVFGDPEKASIKLRFSVKESELNQKQLEDLARQLPVAFEKANVPLRRIDWIKMESSISLRGVGTMVIAANKFNHRRKSRTQEEQSGSSSTPKRQKTKEVSLVSPKKRRGGMTTPSSSVSPIPKSPSNE